MGCTQSTSANETTTAPPVSMPLPTPAQTAPVSTEPEAESKEPEAESKEPEAESKEPEVETEEPEVESKEPEVQSKEPEVETEEPAKKLFSVNGYSIEEDGVVYYMVEPVEGERSFKKRYSDFKALVAALGNPKSLPSLPSGGLMSKVRGKHNAALLKEREAQLTVVLNAVANDAELAQTDAFKAFVA